MARTDRNTNHFHIPFEALCAVGAGAPSKEQKLSAVREIRQNPAAGVVLDEFLLDQLTARTDGLLEAKASIDQLGAVIEQFSLPPFIPALFLARHPDQPLAEVVAGNNRMMLCAAPSLDLSTLRPGDEVVLNQKMTTILSISPFPPTRHGQTAAFHRLLIDGRMMVRNGDEETVIGVAAAAGDEWRTGDIVRYDPAAKLALEKIPADESGGEFRAQALPDIPLTKVGGQKTNLMKMIAAMTLATVEAGIAKRYGLTRRMQTIMLHGPPGVGKTHMVKVGGSHLQRVTGRKCFLYVVKPGAWNDKYVGETERKIRQTFEAMRRNDGISLLFIDEIETVARARNAMGNVHGDKFLGALLVELQGMESDPKNHTVVICATNRPDMLDAAVTSRMELQLAVGRPTAQEAREIFEIHLPDDLPFHSNGHPGSVERERMIDLGVSLFFAPNAAGPLAVLKFRDSSQRSIMPSDLISGRVIEQAARAARQAAAFREVDGGEPGLTQQDIEAAVLEVQSNLATSLTRQNIHMYLSDLKQDMEIMSLEPVVRRVPRPLRYLNPE